MRSDSHFIIDAELVGERSWEFARGDGTVISAALRLGIDGRVFGSNHANESRWRMADGCLEFLNANGAPTTRFDSVTTNTNGSYVLSGRYLGPGPSNVTHVLKQISLPNRHLHRRPKVAVLVRTHLANEKLFDLLEILGRGVGYDLFVCADETRGALSLRGHHVVSHTQSMCAEIGLIGSLPGQNLLWYFGDYAFYCAYHFLSGYDYYALIEYDVEFVRGNALVLEGLIARLDLEGMHSFDLVAAHYGPRTRAWEWTVTCERYFEAIYGVLFPFVMLSKRALDYLYEWRRREAANPPKDGRFAFCEALVPSALNASGKFMCADITKLIPGSWEPSTFRVGTPMLLGSLPKLPRGVELVHPVYSENEFLRRLLNDANKNKELPGFIEMLENPSELLLSAALRCAYLDEVRNQLSNNG